MKRFIHCIVLIVFCIGIGEGLYLIRAGFSLRRIQHKSNIPTFTENVSYWDAEANHAISQRFHFLSRGRQCFAFLSEDNRYVLKLPRTDIYELPFWTRALPVYSYRKQLQQIRLDRKHFVAKSFSIACQDLKEETGIIASHIGGSNIPTTNNTLIIIDRLRHVFHLPLKQTSFLLQRRYSILMDCFLKAIQAKNRKQSETILNAFVDVVAKRAEKGVFFRDKSFLRNFGFDGKKGYLIDIGDFYKKTSHQDSRSFLESLEGTMHPLRSWLIKNDPESLPFLEQKLTKITQNCPEP